MYDALRHLTHPLGVPGENHLRHVGREAPGLGALIHAEASHLHPRDVPEEEQRTRVHVVLVQLLRRTDALVCACDEYKKPFTLRSVYTAEYRSGTVNSNMVNLMFHLIRSYCEIFFYNFPNIPCLKYTVNSNFHLIGSKTLPTNDFELTVPDLYHLVPIAVYTCHHSGDLVLIAFKV